MLLTACDDAPPTPTATVLASVPTRTPASMPGITPAASAMPSPTLTSTPLPSPTGTATPTSTPLLSPTGTATPTSTPLLPPTGTATPTSTPVPLPTDTVTPTLTPNLTVAPASASGTQLAAALRFQTNGEYDRAIAALLLLLDDGPGPELARQARFHLAESYSLDHDYVAAAAAWEDFVADYPQDSRLAKASLMLAQAYHAGGDCVRAISHYQEYLSHDAILAGRVHEWIGDCHADEGRSEEAIAAYRQALDATGDREAQAGLREEIAAAYLAFDDPTAAVREYDAILAIARLDYYRAKIEYLAGQALAAAGQTEAAHTRYRRAVDSYPEAEYAYLSLIQLVDAGAEVDELQRGLVDYYAGEAYPDAYDAAIRAFDRYLAAEPSERADEALYHKAQAQRAVGETAAALDTLDVLIADYSDSEWLARAWLAKGATLASMGNADQASKTYQELAALFPTDDLAPKALWRVAKLREEEGALSEAASSYEKVQSSFPAFEDADESLWRAGLAHYRAGDAESAVADWLLLLDQYPRSSFRPKSLYWLGKLEAETAARGRDDHWARLSLAHPHDYYALRVRQIRSGESLTSTRFITAVVELPAWDVTQAEAEVLAWLSDWAQVPTDTSLIALPDSPTMRRGAEQGQLLAEIGLRREALDTLDDVRAAAWRDPLPLAQLAFFFRDQGFHGLAARSALRLAALWPHGTIYEAPLAVQRLAYPLVYADLLSAEAQVRGLDPLLLAALVRQESLFEPVAESYAGARGLGQVMPATGAGIARSLDMDDFVLDDLFRPSVSIQFGAWYLAAQMKRFDDQILLALAAYNGGPGNTLRWLEAGGPDLDLFVEVITANQSRRYLQQVYRQYPIYERLYRPSGTGEQ